MTNRVWSELEAELSPGHAGRALKILLATDGSDEARTAEDAIRLLPLPSGSEIHVLTVMAAAEWAMPEWFVTDEHSWGKKVAEQSAAAQVREGVKVIAHARSGSAAYEIIEAAEEFDVDLVAVGSKGLSGMKGFFLGSVARNVAKHTQRTVLVARPLRHGLQRVLLAVDGSEHAAAAAQFTAGLALPEGSNVEVASVLRPIQQYAVVAPEFLVEYDEAMRGAQVQQREDAEKLVGSVGERLQHFGKQTTSVILEGDPADQLLRHAEAAETDLLIAGARGVSLIEGLLMGSVADRLLRESKCSVLLVR
jgi:nucleotide-binding universal stress UspA family protein